jgi:hypothetical protein
VFAIRFNQTSERVQIVQEHAAPACRESVGQVRVTVIRNVEHVEAIRDSAHVIRVVYKAAREPVEIERCPVTAHAREPAEAPAHHRSDLLDFNERRQLLRDGFV